MTVTTSKIEKLGRVLFPRGGIKDVAGMVATVVKNGANRDGHLKIWRPDGGWGWFASPGATVVTPNLVVLAFSSDFRRDVAQAREDVYRQLEDATLSVMSEDEIEARMRLAGGMAKRASVTKSAAVTPEERVFSGTFPTGISYADRTVEVHGDYKRLAFLPFSTLILEWSAKRVPEDVRAYIVADAARIQARRGEDYQVSGAGHTVRLGGGGGKAAKSKAQLEREIKVAISGGEGG